MYDRVDAVGEQTSLADRKRRAGQRLMLGFDGLAVTDDLRRLAREIRPAGFVLFARNVAEPAQVLELNRELASLCEAEHPALLGIDQEGGRVQRVRETDWPSMRALGRAGAHTAEVSRGIANELRAMGFNLNFAPVADVDSNPANPVIGARSFGRNPQEVAQQAVSFLTAHQAAGVIACAKHFPGHGDTSVDSHLDLPRVEREAEDLAQMELVPFQAAVDAGVGSVMVAHVLYPAWDEEHPATLSPTIVPRLLRGRMGFDGVAISDDMEMKAIAGRFPVSLQVEQTTRATLDLLLVCHKAKLQEEFFRELVYIQERDPRLEKLTIDSMARIRAMRVRFLTRPSRAAELEVVGQRMHRDLAALVAVRGAD